MTFKLLIFATFLAIARASFINPGHPLEPAYISNPGQLIRTGSSTYGYPLTPGRSFSSGVSGTVIVRSGYSSPYNPYNGRNLPVGIPTYSGSSIHGYGTRTLSYPSSSSYAPILRNGPGYATGFHGGFEGGYGNGYSSGNLQNYIQPSHGSFNGLGNGYHGY